MRTVLPSAFMLLAAAVLPAQTGDPKPVAPARTPSARPGQAPAAPAAKTRSRAPAKAGAVDAGKAAALAAEAAAKADELARRQLLRKIRVLAHRVVAPDPMSSRRAKEELQGLVRGGDLALLGYEAEKAWCKAREFWKRYRMVHARDSMLGTIEIRAQQSRLLGMDTVTTSLGPAGQVRLQLPRTQSTSIGTTVTVPLGVGR